MYVGQTLQRHHAPLASTPKQARESTSLHPNTYGGVVEIDPGNGQTRLLQDPRGEDIGIMLTGVTLWDEKQYLGSLHNDYIGVYDLQQVQVHG